MAMDFSGMFTFQIQITQRGKHCRRQYGNGNQNEDKKFTTYGNALKDDYHFVPIAVETFGTWGSIGHKFITDIGRTIAEITKNPKSTSFIFQAISMAVQRGNVQCVQGAYGESAFEELDEIFYILQPNCIFQFFPDLLKRE